MEIVYHDDRKKGRGVPSSSFKLRRPIFSDGVTEAMLGEEEFGESRFLDELRRTRRLPLEEVVTSVFVAVQQFSAGNQSDDLTLVIARVK